MVAWILITAKYTSYGVQHRDPHRTCHTNRLDHQSRDGEERKYTCGTKCSGWWFELQNGAIHQNRVNSKTNKYTSFFSAWATFCSKLEAEKHACRERLSATY